MTSGLLKPGTAYDEKGSINFQDAAFQIEFLEKIENLISDLEPERISKSMNGYGSTIDTPAPKYGSKFTEIKEDKTDFDSVDANSYFVPAPYRFNIKDGTLMTQFGILKLNQFVGRESLFHFPGHKFSRFERVKFADDRETLFINTKDIGLEISRGYSVQNGIQENYYHWLVLILSKINSRFLEDIEGPKPTLIFSPFENDIQKQSAHIISEYYGLSHISHRDNVTTFVNDLTYPTINRAGGLRPEPLVKDTFSILKGALYDPKYPSHERIYISRRDTGKRVLRNEREVEDLLSERYGFLIVSLSDKDLYDQVNLFSRAKVVISPHGAGLTNIGFCEPQTSVLELQMPDYLNWCYRRLASIHDLRYGFIYGQSDSSIELHSDLRSYKISLESLSRATSEILTDFIYR
jgi:hypothetical protein